MQSEFVQLPRTNSQFVVLNVDAICSVKPASEGDLEIRTMDGQKFTVRQSVWNTLYEEKLKKRIIWAA
jgi:hypothetical protein